MRVIVNLIMNLIMNVINNFDNDESSDYLLKNKMVFLIIIKDFDVWLLAIHKAFITLLKHHFIF